MKAFRRKKKKRKKQLRDEVKKQVKDLIAAYYYEKPEEMLKDMEASHDTMQAFVALVQMFADAFAEKKKEHEILLISMIWSSLPCRF